MSRELKFRAWDGKEMHLPEYADKEDFHLLPDGTIVETHEHGYERHELTSPRGDNWIVMQYTGLKDQNEKEIYEDDIIRLHLFTQQLGEGLGVTEGEEIYIGKIHFGEFGLLFTYGEGEDYFYLLLAPGMLHEESFEIIGNIYEHPQLLNERQKKNT